MSKNYTAFTPSSSFLVGKREIVNVRKCSVNVVFARQPRMTAQWDELAEVKKVILQSLLATSGVAASDTCALLVRNGMVRVNGILVKDPRARVRTTDYITVRGKAIDQAEPDDDSVLPRSQRDFGSEIPEYEGKYNWRIDNGFLARKGGKNAYSD